MKSDDDGMKWYGIDEDIYIALVDLLREARTAAESVGDEDILTYYTFLLGELEEAKKRKRVDLRPATEPKRRPETRLRATDPW